MSDIAFEHEYYDDTAGRHSRCWIITIVPLEEYSFGKDYKFIATKALVYKNEEEQGNKNVEQRKASIT